GTARRERHRDAEGGGARVDRVRASAEEGVRDRDGARPHELGRDRAPHQPIHYIDDTQQRAVAAGSRQAGLRANRSDRRRRDHLRAAPLGGFADLVHILRVRRRAFGTIARGGWAASTFLGQTFALLFVALVLELLCFIHGLADAHGACHASLRGLTTTGMRGATTRSTPRA